MGELSFDMIEDFFKQNNPLTIGGFNKFSDIPQVYHYTNIEALKSIIINKRFWLSNCHFLNDSEEIHYTVDIVKRVYAKRKSNLATQELIEEYIKTCQKMNNLFVLSTSYNKDNLTLWYNYAKNDGYSIGLKLDELIEMVQQKKIKRFGILTNISEGSTITGTALYDKVYYDINEQEQIVSSVLDYFEELVRKTSNFQIIRAYRILSIHSLLICSVFFKNTCFKSEAEFRIVVNVHNGLNYATQFRTSNGGFIPYIELGIEYGTNIKFPINEIIIGPKNKLAIAEKGLKLFLDQLQYQDIHIQKTQIPLRF